MKILIPSCIFAEYADKNIGLKISQVNYDERHSKGVNLACILFTINNVLIKIKIEIKIHCLYMFRDTLRINWGIY